MFESAAICLQLADLHPDAGVMPPLGSAERALVYQWVLFGMSELEAPLYRWVREDSADSPSRERFAQAAAALEMALEGRDWLLGDRFTVADVICASVLGRAHSRGCSGNGRACRATSNALRHVPPSSRRSRTSLAASSPGLASASRRNVASAAALEPGRLQVGESESAPGRPVERAGTIALSPKRSRDVRPR